jgi:hypothetical protein
MRSPSTHCVRALDDTRAAAAARHSAPLHTSVTAVPAACARGPWQQPDHVASAAYTTLNRTPPCPPFTTSHRTRARKCPTDPVSAPRVCSCYAIRATASARQGDEWHFQQRCGQVGVLRQPEGAWQQRAEQQRRRGRGLGRQQTAGHPAHAQSRPHRFSGRLATLAAAHRGRHRQVAAQCASAGAGCRADRGNQAAAQRGRGGAGWPAPSVGAHRVLQGHGERRAATASACLRRLRRRRQHCNRCCHAALCAA